VVDAVVETMEVSRTHNNKVRDVYINA